MTNKEEGGVYNFKRLTGEIWTVSMGSRRWKRSQKNEGKTEHSLKIHWSWRAGGKEFGKTRKEGGKGEEEKARLGGRFKDWSFKGGGFYLRRGDSFNHKKGGGEPR